MTPADMMRLQHGQLVEIQQKGKWVPARVINVVPYRGVWITRVRREGKKSNGRKFAPVNKIWKDIRYPVYPDHDPQPANVYADFLEERGFDEAAALLRHAFPLADGR